MRKRLVLLIVALTVLLCAATLSAQTVPPVYQDLYTSLTNQITAFSNTVNASWNHVPYAVAWAPQLGGANSGLGSKLLATNHYSATVSELDSLKATGAKAITIQIDFPMLYEPFFSSEAEYQQYLNFYTQLASDIRSRGLKLIVECQNINYIPGVFDQDLSAYYNSLSLTDYENGRAQVASVVATQVKPDYMSVITEPDTEASQTGKSELGTVSGSTALLNVILQTLQQSNIQGVSIGAGTGTWISGYDSFAQSYAATSIQYIDMHIYPVNHDYLTRALTVASIAQSAGKKIGITESWLNKVRDSELSTISHTDVLARDPMSFWAPLDAQFFQALVAYAQYEHLAFFCPSWTTYFHAYLDYNVVGTLSSNEILTQAFSASSSAIRAGEFTSTAVAFDKDVVSPPDTTAPTIPGNFAGSTSTSQINLTWSPSTDNVGVAGYKLYRDGNLLLTTTSTSYLDTGLSESTTYTYQLSAYDVPGNKSASAGPLSVSTKSPPDTTPPSVPVNVKAQAVSDTQINITWSPSTDNVGVTSYTLYLGTSSATVAPKASVSTTSYSDTGRQPNSTYYYAVTARDARGNTSALSKVVSGTTLHDTTPPSTPKNVTANAVSTTQVNLSWSASTDNIAVTGYKIYRGKSSTSLILIGNSKTTSYSDTKAQPGVTYYYGVAAGDASGNLSPMSVLVTVTPP